MEIVLISAAKFETQPTYELLNKQGHKVCQLDIGIGPINAAKSCREIAKQVAGRHVIFLGTAGTFTDFKEPYLVTTKEILWLPTSVRTAQAYLIEGIEPPISLHKQSVLVQDLCPATVLCCPAISKTNALPAHLKTKQHIVENLELYSCAAEISDASESFDIILGVTNQIGENAHQQWKANFQHCADLSASYILNKITQGMV